MKEINETDAIIADAELGNAMFDVENECEKMLKVAYPNNRPTDAEVKVYVNEVGGNNFYHYILEDKTKTRKVPLLVFGDHQIKRFANEDLLHMMSND